MAKEHYKRSRDLLTAGLVKPETISMPVETLAEDEEC